MRRVVVLTLLAAATLPGETSFSGDWVGRIADSDFGPLPVPASLLLKVRQEGTALKVLTHQVGGMTGNVTGELKYEAHYATDGTETENRAGVIALRCTTRWEGNVLIITTKLKWLGAQVTLDDRWTLSKDGKRLEILRHAATGLGDMDQTTVYDKN